MIAQDDRTPSRVPQRAPGPGIAGQYVRDVGIEGDERVVLVERFEDDRIASRWTNVRKYPGQISFATDEAHAGKQALRIDHVRGKDSGGHLYTQLKKGYEKLHLRFYVKLPKGHGYLHHFVQLCGYEPGTPWPQGGAGVRPDGARRFTSTLDLYNDWGRTAPPGRWGFYSYWCEMKSAPDGKFWGNEPPRGQPILARTDRWTCVEFMLKCNAIGKRDGEQAFWIDGQPGGRWTGYRWRTDEKLKVNGVWLNYYITDAAIARGRGKPKDEHAFFDDVVVATDYIGPMRSK